MGNDGVAERTVDLRVTAYVHEQVSAEDLVKKIRHALIYDFDDPAGVTSVESFEPGTELRRLRGALVQILDMGSLDNPLDGYRMQELASTALTPSAESDDA